jgi:catechol 2,3-dioxygenase-like lactoylglutathione lyase family enzyme
MLERQVLEHISFEVADLPRSAAFYDALLTRLGARRLHDGKAAIAYGRVDAAFWIVARSRTPGPSFGHVAFEAAGRAAVDAAHASGLAAGGTDAGTPGPRPQYGRSYYAGYLSDPDGYRVELVSGGH